MSVGIGGVWRLCRGDEVIGELTVSEADFPSLNGTFRALPGFAEVAGWFVEELALCEVLAIDDSEAAVDAWESAYARIADTLTLVSPTSPVAAYLLHVDGDQAWFRWNDDAIPE